MATWLAVGALKTVRVPVSAKRTLIALDSGATRIAVTDACSGLEQLGGFVAVGLLFAWLMQGMGKRNTPLCQRHRGAFTLIGLQS